MNYSSISYALILSFWIPSNFSKATAQDVRITEYSAQSTSNLSDENSETSGWVELMNTGNHKVNLNKYALSDTSLVAKKFRLPRQKIASGERVLIILSGKDLKKNNPIHTDFKLNLHESLHLWRRRDIVQCITTKQKYGYESLGAIGTSRGDQLYPYASASPGEANSSGILAAQSIIFNFESGVYGETIKVIPLAPNKNLNLRYTLDGTEPTANSPLVCDGISLDSTSYSINQCDTINVSANGHPFFLPKQTKRISILGAALFDKAGNKQSETEFRSYHLSHKRNKLPIISLIGTWDDLFSPQNGILNPGILRDSLPAGNCDLRGRHTEKTVHLDLIQHGKTTQSLRVGLRTHGGSSRKSQQKGLRVYARKSHGNPNISIDLFSLKTEVSRLALKPLTRSYSGLGIEDHLSSFMAYMLGLEAPRHLFSEVYINGVYQGVYTVHQRIDEKWLQSEYNAQNPVIVSGWGGQTKGGVDSSFVDLMQFVKDHDLSELENYRILSTKLDIANFIDYQIFEQFIANRDWPKGNVKCWKEKNTDSKWRWIFFDGDAGLRFQNLNGFSHAMGNSQCEWCRTGGDSSILMKKLWDNKEFKHQFRKRANHLVKNNLNPKITVPWLSTVWLQLQPTLSDQLNRYDHMTLTKAQQELDNLLSFLKTQPERYKTFLEQTSNSSLIEKNP
ncbi:CotH kinase family protein [Flavobacteriales bacterium]|jgi:hypothetical protein|nr:CotH kinase family protein [Flavobacteriales bacterium]